MNWQEKPSSIPCSLGIDPGYDGAIVSLRKGDTRPMFAAKMPSLLVDGKRQLDLPALLALLASLRPSTLWEAPTLVGLEMLTEAHPGSRGVHSALTMGKNWGRLETALICLGFEVKTIPAIQWQEEILGKKKDRELKDTKDASIAHAQLHYPGLDLMPGKCRTPQDGLSDAICIAEYVNRVLQ